ELDGRLDEKCFLKAITEYVNSNPYLSSRIIEKNGTFYWEKNPEIQPFDFYFLNEISGSAESLFECPPSPVNVYTGPQIKAGIYRNNDHDSVVVSCHHGLCDVNGLKLMAKELFSIYHELKQNSRYRPESKGWYYKGTDEILKKFSKSFLDRVIANEKPFSDRWAFPFEHKGRGVPKISCRTFSPERMKKLKEFGKDYGATVNDILMGAFFLALLKINSCDSVKDFEKSILTSADVRKYYGKEKENYPQNLSVAFEISLIADKSFELKDLINQITAITKEKKAGELGLGCILFYEEMFLKGSEFINNFFDNMILSYNTNNFKNPVFSNIGIIDENYFKNISGAGNKKLEVKNAWFLPVICWPPGFLMTASTFKDSLSIISGYEEGPYSKEAVDKFLLYVDSYLPK
ncbi:MAG: condensation domain-containing protein, partial [Methanomicrobium sp.]|nr:condensation domain-containing protein [Methanomicrobium sp.]